MITFLEHINGDPEDKILDDALYNGEIHPMEDEDFGDDLTAEEIADATDTDEDFIIDSDESDPAYFMNTLLGYYEDDSDEEDSEVYADDEEDDYEYPEEVLDVEDMEPDEDDDFLESEMIRINKEIIKEAAKY